MKKITLHNESWFENDFGGSDFLEYIHLKNDYIYSLYSEQEEYQFNSQEQKALEYLNNPNWKKLERLTKCCPDVLTVNDFNTEKNIDEFKKIKVNDNPSRRFWNDVVNHIDCISFNKPCYDKDELVELLINQGYYKKFTKNVIRTVSHSIVKKVVETDENGNSYIKPLYSGQANTCLDIINSKFTNSIYYDIEQEIATYLWQCIESADVWIDKPMDENGKVIIDRYLLQFSTFITPRSKKECSLYVKFMRIVNNTLYAYSNGKYDVLTSDYFEGKKPEDESIEDYKNSLYLKALGYKDFTEGIIAKSRLKKFKEWLEKKDKKNHRVILEYLELKYLGFTQKEIACLFFYSSSKEDVRRVKHIADKAMVYANMYSNHIDDMKYGDYKKLIKARDAKQLQFLFQFLTEKVRNFFL